MPSRYKGMVESSPIEQTKRKQLAGRRMELNFPVIHTNVWDVLFAVPAIMAITQILKLYFRIRKEFVPAVAVAAGFLFSVLISHPSSLLAGLFMGWFYGYAAIGNYAAMKAAWKAFRDK